MEKRLFISLAGSPDKLTKGKLSTATAAAKQADMQTQSYVSYPPRSHESDLRVTKTDHTIWSSQMSQNCGSSTLLSLCTSRPQQACEKYVSDDLAIAWVETAR